MYSMWFQHNLDCYLDGVQNLTRHWHVIYKHASLDFQQHDSSATTEY